MRRWLILAALLLVPVAGQAQTIEYYGLDAIGSVRVVFDANGNVLSRADYAPFGEPLFPATGKQQQVYAGLFAEGEAGFDYAEARMYQPRTGRFNTVDPVYAALFQPQAWNRYAYALNSPIDLADSDGLHSAPPGCSHFQKTDITTSGMIIESCRDGGVVPPALSPFAQPVGFGQSPVGRSGTTNANGLGKGRRSGPSAPSADPTPTDNGGGPGDPPNPSLDDCQAIPRAPTGFDVVANIRVAEAAAADIDSKAWFPLPSKLKWFYDHVRLGGPWDVKQQNTYPGEFEAMGNFNFGAAGSAMGFSPMLLQRGAGWAQGRSGNRGQGHYLGPNPPFGDDWTDNRFIRRGIAFYHQFKGKECK